MVPVCPIYDQMRRENPGVVEAPADFPGSGSQEPDWEPVIWPPETLNAYAEFVGRMDERCGLPSK